MFRRGSLLVAMLALLCVVPAAHAQGGWMVGVNGGLGIPTGDFADENQLDGKMGFQAGLDVCYQVTDLVAVGVDGSWNQNKHGAEGGVEDLGGGVTLTAKKDKFLSWHAGVHGKFMVPMQDSKVKPYGLLGAGIYNLKEDYEYVLSDGTTSVTFTDEGDNAEQPGSRMGGKVGLGAIFQATEQVGIGVQADYNFITMDKDKFGVSSVQYLGVTAGVSFNLMPK